MTDRKPVRRIAMFLVWYDNDRKRSLAAKVAAAAERYTERFGDAPELVLLNPEQASDTEAIAGLPVRTTPLVSPNHLYIGRADEGENETLGTVAA
jgi:hypothetical protein